LFAPVNQLLNILPNKLYFTNERKQIPNYCVDLVFDWIVYSSGAGQLFTATTTDNLTA
jgi:hypothetical protein